MMLRARCGFFWETNSFADAFQLRTVTFEQSCMDGVNDCVSFFLEIWVDASGWGVPEVHKMMPRGVG